MRHIVALSGGKDSTAMALGLRNKYPKINFEFVITPTGDELPEMHEHWKNLENILGGLTRINGITIFQLIEREQMIPNFRARFCTRVLKIEPFIDFMNNLPTGSISYVGLRADEQDRTGIVRPENNFKIRYPLREWGWNINHVLSYLSRNNITIPNRTDCGCCFNQRISEWKYLLDNYPDRYKLYSEIEKKYGHTFRSPQRDTWPTALKDLKIEFESGRKIRFNNQKQSRCRFCSM